MIEPERDIETIFDSRGTALAHYEPGRRGDRQWAEDLRWADPGDQSAVTPILRALPGWGATTDADLGAALLNAGAHRVRLFHTYTRDLTGMAPIEPELPSGLRPVPASEVAPAALQDAFSAAYPSAHPDHDVDGLQTLAALYDGSLMGPLLPCSTVAWDGRRAVAAVLVQDTGGEPPLEGAWISDVFRRPGPDHAGLGALLLRVVLARAASSGIAALGLSVTDGNPARIVYERIGFHHTASWIDLIFPASQPTT
ncbi:GNAT family N-acetyltransferase [Nocardia arthritidis]|uniref:GNAT family N-acetyltransferase n=1 Tax=Nocardia arthritidis TaxID=228602 RepID=A0A6G9YAR3_9NOCA|nr:GNAT family N-acetyltransferase [Nocardia arthritidis]QIS10146.1 GNAT family N-acetyltransferase [Nocardia arthritidis]